MDGKNNILWVDDEIELLEAHRLFLEMKGTPFDGFDSQFIGGVPGQDDDFRFGPLLLDDRDQFQAIGIRQL